jgi:hypothetical protein
MSDQAAVIARASKTFSDDRFDVGLIGEGREDERFERQHRFVIARLAIRIRQRNHHAAPGHRFLVT